MIGTAPRIDLALWAGQLALLAALVAAPFLITTSYVLDVMIVTGLWIALGLSYAIVVGYVGSLSLAHPAFFGIGAYAVALLTTNLGWTTVPALLAAGLIPAVAALVVGIPSFRLSQYSFAIGTLGFATVAQLLAQNWIELTAGPMCVTRIPKAEIGGLRFDTLPAFYLLMLGIVVAMLLFVRRLVGSRIGRSFLAVRENEPLASAVGVNPLRYKLIAFSLSAMLAGVIGGLYAYYINVVCPSELALYFTLNLLVILFVGGAASLPGVVIGAVLAIALPELLRVTVTWRLVLFGVALLVIINFFPEGVGGAFERIGRRFRRRRPPHPVAEPES